MSTDASSSLAHVHAGGPGGLPAPASSSGGGGGEEEEGASSIPWHAYPPGMAWHGMAHELLLRLFSRVGEP
ncbi:hypothetical protein ColLi_04922 [Colletotrichum liriopes]|uniref:Uncharacterized protein n=1 Tax=Colletotrichum liriopes TaxID=708192 RepID=A0AA37GJZ5_9PEZI|nr:hypothetical protein ColLi_04922 [Colletotrichum liriopes]